MPCPILSAVLLPALAVYPDHPVRIVTPVAPGGGNDVVTRMPREIVGRIIREPEIDETFIEFGIGPPGTRPEELGKISAPTSRAGPASSGSAAFTPGKNNISK
jgi:tripartite-type tricarboxylate transporter receptor subunit TctC